MEAYAWVAVKTLHGAFMHHELMASRAGCKRKKNIENRVRAVV